MRFLVSEKSRVDKKMLTLSDVDNTLETMRKNLIRIDMIKIDLRRNRTSRLTPVAEYKVNGITKDDLINLPWEPTIKTEIFEQFADFVVISFKTKYTGAGSLKVEIIIENPKHFENKSGDTP